DNLAVGSGKISLRAAIAVAGAEGGETITFDPAVFPAGGTATIVLLNDAEHDALFLRSDMTIVGPGSKALTVKGTGSSFFSSVIVVGYRVAATISGLTVTGGHAYQGGGIENLGRFGPTDVAPTLTLTDVGVVGNFASDNGGGIYSAGNL